MSKNTAADSLIHFLNASPTPFHAVETAVQKLSALGALALDEKTSWQIKPWRFAYLTRNQSSIVAIRLPSEMTPNQIAFHIIAAHTDSPCLKLKPRAPEPFANYKQWGAEVYGGALYNSWLDRDLGIAGRISYVNADGVQSKLVRLEEKPIRIPQLAIHLDRNVNDAGLILNPQKHLTPILGLTQPLQKSFESSLEEIVGMPLQNCSTELHLYDTSPACYGGYDDEFIYSGRLDNLAMSHAALEAFASETAAPNHVQIIALFDHEEVGSTSAQGANSNLIEITLERIILSLGLTREDGFSALARSKLISADMAHAIHPNYPEKHEPNHFPLIGKGPVLKGNVNMRYATNSESAAHFKNLCKRAGVPCQEFISRTDLACGTTIGPHVSAALGISTVDVGNSMLSMHSAREMCGADDHGMMIRVMREFLKG